MPNPDPVFVSVPGRSFAGNPYFSLLIDGLEQSGAKVADAKALRQWVGRRVILSRTSREQFYRDNPGCRQLPELLLPHGPYRTCCSEDCGANFRRELGVPVDRILVGFLGAIKKYKNIRALEALPPGVSVLMAGKCDGETAGDALLAEMALADRVRRIDRQLSNAELERAIRACDLVLIPYLTGYNSGMALLSLTCGTPVLTSRLPIFEELQEDFGKQWVCTFDSPQDIPGKLQAVLGVPRNTHVRRDLQAVLEVRSFSGSASSLTQFATGLVP